MTIHKEDRSINSNITKIRKKAKVSLFALFALGVFGYALQKSPSASAIDADWKRADVYFEKKTYQKAMEVYTSIYKKVKGKGKYKALYRMAECKVLLFRYGEALQLLAKAKLPDDPLWKARMLILKAELYREFLKQYGYAARKDVVEGEEDVTRKTPQEMHHEIQLAFSLLWELRHKLVRRPIEAEKYYVEVEKSSMQIYPTLWDFVVLRWIGYLLREAPLDKTIQAPKAMLFLQEEYPLPREDQPIRWLPEKGQARSVVHQAAVLMEDAAHLGGKGRGLAKEMWKIQRLMLPFRYAGKVSWPENRRKIWKIAAQMLERWMRTFEHAESKAEAGESAAKMLYKNGEYIKVLKLCAKVQKSWKKTRGAKKCAKLAARIKKPSLYLTAELRRKIGYLPYVSTTNLKRVYFRMYVATPSEITTKLSHTYRYTWSNLLGRADRKVMQFFLEERKPLARWDIKVKLPKPISLYKSTESKVKLPATKLGIYFLVASNDKKFRVGESLITGLFLNRTELILLGTSGLESREKEMIYTSEGPHQRKRNGFRFYALDALSGAPVEGANLDIKLQHRSEYRTVELTTSEDGIAQLPLSVSLVPVSYDTYYADPLAQSGRSYAYWSGDSSLSFSPPAPVRLYVDIDRPIYRPGQEVQFKVTVLQRVPQGLKVYGGNAKVHARVSDPNGKEIFTVVKNLNEMGSFTSAFEIPTGRLLGSYRITASIVYAGESYSSTKYFSVEEYKRPEFEVKLKDTKSLWRFGKRAKVEGEVKYYFGGPVPDANVTVKVSRQPYIPYYAWWWSRRYGGSDKTEVLNRKLKTGKEGKFFFTFTPQPVDPYEKTPVPAQFTVEVEARDPGGRTITAQKSYKASGTAYLFSIEPPAGFFIAGKPISVPTKLMNINGQSVKGSATFRLYKITKQPKQRELQGGYWGNFPESPSLEQIYKDAPNGEQIMEGSLQYDGKKSQFVKPESLAPGVYRLTLTADDPWGGEVSQSLILLVIGPHGKKPLLHIQMLTLPEQTEYEVGETARILIGSSILTKGMFVEIWGGRFLLSRKWMKGGKIHLFEIPITEDHKGGFSIRWFGVKDFVVYSGKTRVSVPWKEKNLVAELQYDKTLAPAQKATWSLSVKDREGRKVDGEALVTMYDRSLEYYAQLGASWVKSLYFARSMPNGGNSSLFVPYANSLPIEKGWVKKMWNLYYAKIREPSPPSLRINRSRVRYKYYKNGAAPSPKKAMKEKEMADGTVEKDGEPGAPPAPPASTGPPPKEEVQLRKDFSETAFFQPQLKIKDGKGVLSFKVPEQLTSWRILAYVVTKELKIAFLSEETVTKKDLMVRVEIPRYFREGDEGTIKAVVHNETSNTLHGQLTLKVTENGRRIEKHLSLENLKQDFAVKPHGLTPLAWSLKIPDGITTYKVRAIVRAGRLSDAEERDLPILPSRQRLIETLFLALNGTMTKTMVLKRLKEKDPTRINERLELQIDPQLALTIMNSIPFLVHYPFECVEQVLNRFVPLSIMHEVYKKHPSLAKAVKKIPKRHTITPTWDRKDPKRLMKLMETPWEEISKGRKSYWPIIDMLAPKVVKREKEDALDTLLSYQLASGGFPWFPGGRADPYITLYVLDGFAMAQKYGVTIPEDVVRRALRYVNNEIPKQLKPDERNVSLILYAAYVVTSYPEKYPEAKQGYKFAKAWIKYAEKVEDAMTPYGEALAAYVFWRLGEKEKGNLYLERALDGAREDPITGVYWAPEKMAWLWYNDTVEKHAFFLRTLQTIRPEDKRIPGMVQWLLFSRKGTEWKSTKATAAAIYALLDYMEGIGALEKGDTYRIVWGDLKDTVKVKADDWLAKPLRWEKKGGEITKKYAAPKVEKRGPGFAFASLTWIYASAQIPEASAPGLMNVRRKFFRRVKKGDAYHLVPLQTGGIVQVGDQIEVQLTITTRNQFEYVLLKDPKAAGFEAETLTSGWKWDQISRYEEPRDSLTNFFIDWLPRGEYILRYRLRPTLPGKYRIGAAIIQSMYAPEFAGHSAGFEIVVKP